MALIYIDINGNEHFYTDNDEAMKAYAEAGFAGSLRTPSADEEPAADTAPSTTLSGITLIAVAIGMNDSEATLVTALDGGIYSNEATLDDVDATAVSWYDYQPSDAYVEWLDGIDGVEFRQDISIHEQHVLAHGVNYLDDDDDDDDDDGQSMPVMPSDDSDDDTAGTPFSLWGNSSNSSTPQQSSDSEDMWGQVPVDEVGAAIIAENQEYKQRMGIVSTSKLWYAPGTPLNSWGHNNLTTARQDHNSQPTTEEGAEAIAERIDAEMRDDKLVRIDSLRMDSDGSVAGYMLEDNAFGKLLARAGCFPRGTATMLHAPPEIRAEFYNNMLEHFAPTNEVMLRTRVLPGSDRSIYAVVGPKYPTDLDGARFARIAAEVFQGTDSRGRALYDVGTTEVSLRAGWFQQNDGQTFVGSDYAGGAELKTRDDGGGAYSGLSYIWRCICRNLTTVTEHGPLFRRIHRGDLMQLESDLREALHTVPQHFAHYMEQWGYLQQVEAASVLLWGKQFKDVPEALQWGVEHGKIMQAVATDVATQLVLWGFDQEPGETLDALVNSITRAAQKVPVLAQRAEVEAEAGDLTTYLYNVAA